MNESTIDIPLNLGVRRDLTDLPTAAATGALAVCENVSFTAEGAVRPRPGAVSLDAPVISRAVPGGSALNLAASGRSRTSLSSLDGSALLLGDGAALLRRDSLWQDLGSFWGVRAEALSTRGTSIAGSSYSAGSFGAIATPHVTDSIFAYNQSGELYDSLVDGRAIFPAGLDLVGFVRRSEYPGQSDSQR